MVDEIKKEKQRAIFRTKEEILGAVGMGKVEIQENVQRNPDFINSSPKDLLGFKIIGGSDFKVIDVKSVKNNPQAFMQFAFGETIVDGTD